MSRTARPMVLIYGGTEPNLGLFLGSARVTHCPRSVASLVAAIDRIVAVINPNSSRRLVHAFASASSFHHVRFFINNAPVHIECHIINAGRKPSPQVIDKERVV